LKNRAQLVIALERTFQTAQCLSNNVAVRPGAEGSQVFMILNYS
jgi:hypothetical protein